MQQETIELIERYKTSGMTQIKFAVAEGVPYQRLQYYLKCYRHEQARNGGEGFVAIRVRSQREPASRPVNHQTGHTITAILYLDGTRRLVMEGVAAGFLRELVGC